MTCRDFGVGCCGVECQDGQGGDQTVPIWVSFFPFPIWSPGSEPNYQHFPDIRVTPNCSPWSQASSSLNYPPFRGAGVILWLGQDAPLLRKLQGVPFTFSMVS